MKSKSFYVLSCIIIVLIAISDRNALAHKVTTAANVGAVLHLEPNDNPRAGEPTKTWFALTRKGGKVIPLTECDCKLSVYAQPYSPGEPPLLEPPLQPVTAERYQGIPGTEIKFPRPGAYQLQLSGKPKQKNSFQPFELKYDVTVVAGKSAPENTQSVKEVNDSVTTEESRGVPIWAIALSALAAVGVFLMILRGVKRV
ncbi:MAG: hypothetical protein SAL70_02055 [Scytonema sp. PMC 1070.18]|nr:hypothetical protein [Scytonema sp. PMC 1070.18]